MKLYFIQCLFASIDVFFKNLGTYLQSFYVSFIGTDMLRVLRARVLKNVLRLDMDFLNAIEAESL